MTMTVLVAEDFGPFRDLICAMLKANSSIRVDCAVDNGIQAVEKAAELQPHLVLMDIGLPGLNGIEAARRIKSLSPKSRIIFLTQEHSPDVVAEALATGASGYVVKADAGTELMVAIDTVLRDGRFVGEKCRGVIADVASDRAI